MTAYRLHFDRANLEAIELINRGRIGEPVALSSVFSYQVRRGNIRLDRELGGGALFDIGIYCINAARSIFQAEPQAVFGRMIFGQDERFSEVEGSCMAHLSFPQGCMAQFFCSFDAAPVSTFQVIGTKGSLRLDPAYEYESPLAMELSVNERSSSKKYKRSDQFAGELNYFSDCIRKGRNPESDGFEGLADLRVIEAIRKSAASGRMIELDPYDRTIHPGIRQVHEQPSSSSEPSLIHAQPPSQ